jgi:hypothetical protein
MTFTGSGPLLPDGQQLRCGTSADLRIYHDGNNSFIADTGTGGLYIQGSTNINIRDHATSENHITCAQNGAVTLFHNGNSKLATTSGGINVTGSVQCDGLASDGNITISSGFGTVNIQDDGNTGAGAQSQVIFKDSAGTNQGKVGYLANNNVDLYVANELSGNLVFTTAGASRCYVDGTGHFRPAANNTYDLGGSTTQWRNGYFDGTVFCDALSNDGTSTFSGDATFNGGAGAITVGTNGDIRFGATGSWSGNAVKIQHHDNALYISGGSNGIRFREDGTDRCVIDGGGNFHPSANNQYDLGTSSLRWRNVYTNDLNLSNEGGANDVDGTWGNWTIQEGEDDLFLLNRRNGKKYKFNLSEVN